MLIRSGACCEERVVLGGTHPKLCMGLQFLCCNDSAATACFRCIS